VGLIGGRGGGPDIGQNAEASLICRVVSVSRDGSKVVKLRITNEPIEFCNLYRLSAARATIMDINDPKTHCSNEFEIMYDPDRINHKQYPYYFKNIYKLDDGKVQPRPTIHYTFIKKNESAIDVSVLYNITKVQPLTASQ
jgi:hypothetical protein